MAGSLSTPRCASNRAGGAGGRRVARGCARSISAWITIRALTRTAARLHLLCALRAVAVLANLSSQHVAAVMTTATRSRAVLSLCVLLPRLSTGMGVDRRDSGAYKYRGISIKKNLLYNA